MAKRTSRTKVFNVCFREASKHAKKGHAAFDRALHTCIVRKAGGKAYGETLTERDYQVDAKWQSRKYGLPASSALKLAKSKNREKILDTVEAWQRQNGYPASSSPLTRGYLLKTLQRFGGYTR